MFNSKFVSFAKYVPENIVTNDDLSKIVETSDEWIFSRTGIKERRISLSENTSQICANAGREAILKANMLPLDIDLIITATITPDFATPSTACIVQKEIGAKNAVAFDISAACSGFVFALSIADKFIKSGSFKNALIIGGEVFSKAIDWTDRGTCVLFGDGAGACVIKASDTGGIISEDLHSDGENYMSLTSSHTPISNPFTKENVDESLKWLKMDGREIFNFATRKVPASINAVVEKANLSLDDIKYIVPHQANSRIVEIIARKLKLPMERFFMNMDKYGNTSSASIPIALSEMYDLGLLKEKDKIIITGFGAGLTWGTSLIEL